MSDRTKAALMVVAFVGWLAGSAWGIAKAQGYRFWPTMLGLISAYVLVLLGYACFRRIQHRGVKVKRAQNRPAPAEHTHDAP